MNLIAQINLGMDEGSRHIGIYAVVALAALFIWRIIHWFLSGPKTPDPWDSEVAEELANDRAEPLCPHCLTRHEELAHLCPACGAPVGAFTSLMPALYLFSIGHIFRMGTTGTFKRSPFIVFGYFFAAFAAYALVAPLFIFTPVYWGLLWKNITRLRLINQSELSSPVDSAE